MLEFRSAVTQALAAEMDRDETVVVLGEDVAAAGGVFKVTEGLLERFGPNRVVDTPISELALAGAAFGAAVAGLRPVLEIMFGDFMALPMDSLVNQAAKYWYLSGSRQSVPLVVRTAVGAGGRFGAVHSQNPGTWLHGVPGLKVVAPSSPAEAQSMLVMAIRDPNPVVFLEHKRLYSAKGDDTADALPIGRARIVRHGDDVTIAAIMKGVVDALAAADALASDGISCEVIDLRSLRPLDVDTVAESLSKTNRLLIVEEGPQTGGWASGLLGSVTAQALEHIDDAWLLTTPDHPIPYGPGLEDGFLPSADSIAGSVSERLARAR